MVSITAYGMSVSITLEEMTITRYVDSLNELGVTLHYYQNWYSECQNDAHRFFNELLTQVA
ncbi:hypothetical protein Lepto7375DRAFT_7264 [Leptolyngbya sp. PCC 7375]|nr:hypothetical protein Lepto7375DRAFT_7264 [Leptolyngbya sp. PCC 7375]